MCTRSVTPCCFSCFVDLGISGAYFSVSVNPDSGGTYICEADNGIPPKAARYFHINVECMFYVLWKQFVPLFSFCSYFNSRQQSFIRVFSLINGSINVTETLMRHFLRQQNILLGKSYDDILLTLACKMNLFHMHHNYVNMRLVLYICIIDMQHYMSRILT